VITATVAIHGIAAVFKASVAWNAKPACAGYGGFDLKTITIRADPRALCGETTDCHGYFSCSSVTSVPIRVPFIKQSLCRSMFYFGSPRQSPPTRA
jgi:hypothetical protein